jgi:anti-anti-sigma factor
MGQTPVVISFERDEYDIATCDEFAAALEPAYDAPDVILDLSAITYLDSTCLGKLASMRDRRAKSAYLPARMVISAKNITRLFKLVAFDKVWPIFETLDAALAYARD